MAVLSKYSNINKYLIDLEPDKQLFYKSIYSLGPVKLETLKTYFKINLTNGFIEFFLFLASKSIFFIKKPNRNFCLYIDYQNLNNLTIKKWYLFLLISKFLDHLKRIKNFI